SRKLVAVGQAIDVDRFASEHEPHDGPLRAVVIGRYSPAKGVDTIVRAVALAAGVRLDVYGPAPNGEARRERAELERLVGELGLADRVELHGALRRDEVARVLAGADVLVNNAPGGADRIVYEAAASGVPVLASNPAHADLLEADAFYPRGDASALAAKLRALAVADRDEIGRRLRERVRRDHAVGVVAPQPLPLPHERRQHAPDLVHGGRVVHAAARLDGHERQKTASAPIASDAADAIAAIPKSRLTARSVFLDLGES